MAERSDINTGKIFLVGSLGVIVTVAVTLVAIDSYYAIAAHVEQSRNIDAAVRIQQLANEIAQKPEAQPWLNPDLQRATQKAQLDAQPAHYPKRTITWEDGSEQVYHAIPIEQAMEAVVREAEAGQSAGARKGG